MYKVGDWVMVKFPQENTGHMRKLSQPWHSPYHVVDRRDPDVTMVKVYSPQDGQIQIHQNRVVPCLPELLSVDFSGMGPNEPDLNDHQSGSTSCYRVTSLPVRAEMIHSMIKIPLGLIRVKL